MAKKKFSRNDARSQKQVFALSAPGATSVQLAGDFTQWQDHPVNLQKGTDGIWRTTVELKAGTHHYRCLVDGQWRDDPECTLRSQNPYGSENMLRQVT